MHYLTKALSWYLLWGYINQWWAINMTAPYGKEPLHDIGFKLLPQISSVWCDALLVLLGCYFVCRWILIDQRKLTDFLNIMGYIFILRLCCFSFTTVPFPNESCIPKNPNDPMIWNVFPYLTNNHTRSCYDLMFSGHASHVILIALFTVIYSKIYYERVIITALAVLCLPLIIAAQIHYSHDVIVAIGISLSLFGTYFSARQCPFFYSQTVETVAVSTGKCY